MKPLNKGRFIFTVLLLLFVLSLIWASFSYAYRLRLVPLIIAVPTLIFLVVLLIREFVAGGIINNKKNDITKKAFLRISTWLLIFPITIFLLGFFISIPLLTFAFLLIEAKLRWQMSLLQTIIISVSFHLLFEFALEVNLWTGFIPEIIPALVGGGILPPL